MVEENPRVGGRLKSDSEAAREGFWRRRERGNGVGGNSVRRLGKFLCE